MKKYKLLYSLFLIFFIVSCDRSNAGDKIVSKDTADHPVTTTDNNSYVLSEAFPKLQFDAPVELTSPDDNTNRVFVLAQKGVIHVFPQKQEVAKSTIFLDISNKVESGGEKGLLGLAFHPDYKNNGYFYVNYTKGNPLETVIARYKVSASDPNVADPASELILLKYRQPYENHNGGKVAFGNDGFLYIAVGDGGSGGDPGNRAQNKKELLGKILRIDVNKPSANSPYSIPADNPFHGNTDGAKEEIYSYGMRNPWRFSFDKQTGALWAGDVGQDKIEEVDVIEKGGNYGWNIMEADECFKSDNCSREGLTTPIWSYHQGSETGHSVTGGYVCHDKNLPALDGKYVFGDFVSGNIWALTYSGKKAVKNELIAKLSDGLSSFGQDSQSNLYVLAYGSGKIYKISGKK